MVNEIPESWSYNENLENMLFFYQISEEMLSYVSPDSFRLPVCNSMTLCIEIRRIYDFLYKSKQIERYYSKYIPCIIDELISEIQQDSILKNQLGNRLESIITGLISAKEIPTELIRWINLINQSCTLEEHKKLNKSRIKTIISGTKDKKELAKRTQEYYIDLIGLGYSPEFLYQSIIRFFNNRNRPISSIADIEEFFKSFENRQKEFEFYIVADTFLLNSFSEIDPQFGKHLKIKEISETELLCYKHLGRVRKFNEVFNSLRSNGNESIKMLSCRSEACDPYSAFHMVSGVFDLFQCFDGYFKHKAERRIIFDILQKENDQFTPIKLRKTVPNRPYLEQGTINRRTDTILNQSSITINVMMSLFRALDMHFDALNCKNAETMLRTFWTALETLFFESDEKGERENAKYCLLHIVQKTYLLKQLRLIYNQLIKAITNTGFWDSIDVSNFIQFVKVFMDSPVGSDNLKKFTDELAFNPLLRSRVYNFRKELTNCKSINQKISKHKERVSWHIDRIYRTRNLSTHAGISMPYIDEILFNIHNYFDYAVNYIICKIENKHYIHSISSLVFESKNDNAIHLAYLSKNEKQDVTSENCLDALFGPDHRIIEYNFEVVFEDIGI